MWKQLSPGEAWRSGRAAEEAPSSPGSARTRSWAERAAAVRARWTTAALSSGSTSRIPPTPLDTSTPAGRNNRKKISFSRWSSLVSCKIKVLLTCLTMRRERMFITKPPSRGYMVRDWMTVRMSSMGRGFCSISCCITTAKTSDVYTFFSAKQRLVAVGQMLKIKRWQQFVCPRPTRHVWGLTDLLWWTSCHIWLSLCCARRWGGRLEWAGIRRNSLHLQNTKKSNLSPPQEVDETEKWWRALTVLSPQQPVKDLLHYNRVQFDKFGQSLDDFVLHEKNKKNQIEKTPNLTGNGSLKVFS